MGGERDDEKEGQVDAIVRRVEALIVSDRLSLEEKIDALQRLVSIVEADCERRLKDES